MRERNAVCNMDNDQNLLKMKGEVFSAEFRAKAAQAVRQMPLALKKRKIGGKLIAQTQ